MSGTFVTHVVTDLKRRWSVGTVIREVFPIFQLALSSPVNWDSKAQNDRWEKREDESWRWGLWWMTSHRELYNRCWKFWMVTWDLGSLWPGSGPRNFHEIEDGRPKQNPTASNSFQSQRKELLFSFKINRTFHICLEGGTMSSAAKKIFV